MEFGFWIPIISGILDSLSCIPDSTCKIFPDLTSRIRIPLLRARFIQNGSLFDLTQSAKGVTISTVNFRKLDPPCISPSKYKPDKIVTQKTLRWNAPPNISPPPPLRPPEDLNLEIALKYGVKQRKTVNFLPRIRPAQSILTCKFPSVHMPLRM